MPVWAQTLLDRHPRRRPDALALRDDQREVRWAQLVEEVERGAHALAAWAAPGDRVIVMSRNCVEVLEVYIACAVSGIIAVPLNTALAGPEVELIVAAVRPSAVIGDSRSLERECWSVLPRMEIKSLCQCDIASLPAPTCSSASPSDKFAILHTSATTGRPKGAVYSNRTVEHNATAWLLDVPVAPGTTFLNSGHLSHATMVIALHYLLAGGTVCLLEAFTPQAWLRAVERWAVRHSYLVPAMAALVVSSKVVPEVDLSTLELLFHGAAPMSNDLGARVKRVLGVELLCSYGSTEAGGPALSLHSQDRPSELHLPGAVCIGLPLPGYSVDIRGPRDKPVPDGDVGEIVLSSGGFMDGYWQDETATAAVLSDGTLRTGDMGFVDQRGYVWIVDRRNDLIISGGENVYPAQVESVLRKSQAIRDVVVLPCPSDAWGQVPVAVMSLSAKITGERERAEELDEVAPSAFGSTLYEAPTDLARELARMCAAELASFKAPTRYYVIDEIPRNPSGKVLRRLLRAQLEELGHV